MAGSASFLLYIDDLADLGKLTDKEAGQLLKAIVAYQTTGEMPSKLPVRADIMFGYIRRSLDKNRDRYEKTCRARAEAGKRGGRPKKQEEAAPSEPEEEKQNKANKANAFFAFSEKAKKPEYEHDHEHDHEHEYDHEYDISSIRLPKEEQEAKISVPHDEMMKRKKFLETMIGMYSRGDLHDEVIRREYQEELDTLMAAMQQA